MRVKNAKVGSSLYSAIFFDERLTDAYHSLKEDDDHLRQPYKQKYTSYSGSLQFLAKCNRFHINIDYFLSVVRMKIKLGQTLFEVLKISKTNKYSKFELSPWQHDDFKMPVFFLSLLNISEFLR